MGEISSWSVPGCALFFFPIVDVVGCALFRYIGLIPYV
jgi:hypothetical protein